MAGDLNGWNFVFSSDEEEAVENRVQGGDSGCDEAQDEEEPLEASASDLQQSPFDKGGRGSSTSARPRSTRESRESESTWVETGAHDAGLGEEFESLTLINAALKVKKLGALKMHSAVANQLFVTGGASVSSAGASTSASSGAPAGRAPPTSAATATGVAAGPHSSRAWFKRASALVERRPRGMVHQLELGTAVRRRRNSSSAAPGVTSEARARSFGFLNWYDSKQDYEVGLATLHLGKAVQPRAWRGSRSGCSI